METFPSEEYCGDPSFMTTGRLNPDAAEFVPHRGLNVNASVFVPGHVAEDSALNPGISVIPPDYMSIYTSAVGIDLKATLFYQNIEHRRKIPRLNPNAKEFVPMSLTARYVLNPLASEFQPRFSQKNTLRYSRDVVIRNEMKLQRTWGLQTDDFLRDIVISELLKLFIPYLLCLMLISVISSYIGLLKIRADIARLVVKMAEVVKVAKMVKLVEVVEVMELQDDEVVDVEEEKDINEEEEEELVYIVDDDDDISTLIFMCR